MRRTLALCEACEADLPWQRPGCQRCGVSPEDSSLLSAPGFSSTAESAPQRGQEPGQCPASGTLATDTCQNASIGQICLNCQHSPPAFDRCIPLFAYQQPVSGMINRFKQHAGFSEARCLGLLMRAAFRQFYLEHDHPPPAYLVPVPLHPGRLRQRGFNQALLLCNYISGSSGIPVLRHACERRPSQHSQRGLGAQARHLNMQGAFYHGTQAHLTAGQHIAIIDDVVTTTATVNEMSGVLRQSSTSWPGAVRIDIWSIARAN